MSPQPPARFPDSSKLGFMLSGGGARAAYQTGVLCAIGEKLPGLRIPILTGVSAGAINLGFLAAYGGSFKASTRALRRRWLSLTTEEVFQANPTSLMRNIARVGASLIGGGAPFAPQFRSLVDTAPLRAFLERSIAPNAITERLEADDFEAIALSTMSYQTGRTVIFLQGDTPVRVTPRSAHHRFVRARLSVDHIMASAAIPLLFPAIKIGQQYYGDGSFRSAAPLGPAIQLGANRVFAISARYRRSIPEASQPEVIGYPPPARVLGLLLNSVFLDTLDWDAAMLERINHLIDRIPPEERREDGLRHVDLFIQRPSRDIGLIAAEFEDRLPRSLRFMVRGLGTSEIRSADLISYLLFDSAYLTELIELGESDVLANWPALEEFLAPRAGRESSPSTA